jgi:deleted-in-malignant-brain-tumors protein 1
MTNKLIGAYYRQWSYYGLANVSAPIHLDYMDCVGTETNLASCPHLYPVGYTTCGINQVAGVVCTSGGTCTNGNIRLVRNSNGTPLKSQGRVEVCHNSQWGTVCDDFWGTNDAKVACYQLGFSKDGATSYSRAAFGQGYGPIYLDNLGCSSAETSLFSCPSNGVGSHNCGHNEDAGARCNGEITTSCTNGDVMLWRAFNGAGPEYFGLALYCKNNAWTGVCDDSYTCHTARLFCQQLGYPGAILKRSRNFWGYYKTIDHYAWSCSSSHSSLSECNYYYHTSCNSLGFDLMGFACYPNIQGTSCTDGEVRLVNGTTSFNGRPEYCFEGEWAPMCSLQSRTASLMCKQLGFSSDYAITYNDERFGISMTRSNLGSVSCPNSATSLSQCQAVRKSWSGGCYLSISQCGTEYGLQCFNNTGSCVDGSIRLVNGTIQQEGRLEVCSQGIWGIVCQSSWNSIDAYIACKMLGYNGAGMLLFMMHLLLIV